MFDERSPTRRLDEESGLKPSCSKILSRFWLFGFPPKLDALLMNCISSSCLGLSSRASYSSIFAILDVASALSYSTYLTRSAISCFYLAFSLFKKVTLSSTDVKRMGYGSTGTCSTTVSKGSITGSTIGWVSAMSKGSAAISTIGWDSVGGYACSPSTFTNSPGSCGLGSSAGGNWSWGN